MRDAPPQRQGSTSVNLEVGNGAWAHLHSLKARHSLTDDARAFREHLGIPTDRPIIMSGHQAEWWHPGILAKLLSARAIADRIGGAVVWLIVDQDDNDPGTIDLPVIQDGGRLETIAHRLAPPATGATGWRAPISPAPVPPSLRVAPPSAQAGFDRITASMRTHAAEPSLARQIGHGSLELARTLGACDAVVFASELPRTAAFAGFIARTIADPRGCVEAYNAPASRLGAEHVRPLQSEPDRNRWELPFWSIDAAGARMRIWSDSPALRDPTSLMPRALAMTALVRLGACDLFIHGLGGRDYDTVTDAWIPAWLGRTLAPTAMATADVRLPLSEFAPDELTVRDMVEKAHRARHDPALLGDRDLRDVKDDLVASIAALRARGEPAAAKYREMQDLLAAYRESHADALQSLRAGAQRTRTAFRASRDTLLSRTWAFPLYPQGDLEDLAARVSHAVAESQTVANARS